MLKELDEIKKPSLRERIDKGIVKTIIGAKERLGLGENADNASNVQNADIQSVIISRDYTLPQAKEWIKHHNFINKKIDTTDNYYRFRQKDPNKYHRFITKDIADGVKVVIGFS